MKSGTKHGPLHAPKTGPGYSTGKKPPMISKAGACAHVGNKAGLTKPAIADPKR